MDEIDSAQTGYGEAFTSEELSQFDGSQSSRPILTSARHSVLSRLTRCLGPGCLCQVLGAPAGYKKDGLWFSTFLV